MQSPIHTFISSLEVSLSSVFPSAEISFDGENLSVYFKRSDADGDFVMLLVDLTCMDEENVGSISVHARPDHIFEPHWIMENESRTLVLENGHRFVDGTFDGSEEFSDGHGNSMWMFEFPDDEADIAELIIGLASISASYFGVQINADGN